MRKKRFLYLPIVLIILSVVLIILSFAIMKIITPLEEIIIFSGLSCGGSVNDALEGFSGVYISNDVIAGGISALPYSLLEPTQIAFLTWYLAEGATLNNFDEWILIMNPCSSQAEVTVTFMRAGGLPPIEKFISVGPKSRFTIYVNGIVPNESVSTKVESTNEVPIIAERAMYRTSGDMEWACAHDCIGVTSPAITWYLAEGATLNNFDEWILIMNPCSSQAEVTVTFMRAGGLPPIEKFISVGPTSRFTIYVNGIVPNESVSTKVESTNGVPIIAERAMYRTSGGIDWVCAHDSVGVTSPATTWYLAEGATLNNFDEWVLIMNPSSSQAEVTVTFMRAGGLPPIEKFVSVGPTSRFTIYVNGIVPNESVSTKVESTNGVPIIAERAMYRTSGGIDWVCAHDSVGVTSPATTWYLAEGATLNNFDEWILIMNPWSSQAEVTVTFMRAGGLPPIEKFISVGPTSRFTIYVNGIVPNESISTKVESTNGVPIIAERAMYRTSGGIDWTSAHDSVGVPSDSF